MVLSAEDNVLYSSTYNQVNNMNTYGYSPQPHEQCSTQMGNQDGYGQYQVSYSDPNIQQLAQSASWAGVYAARSGHGSTTQGTITHGQGQLLDEWSSPNPQQQYCTSSNSDSSPSPNGYSYPMYYRSPISANAGGMDYGMPSPRQTPTPTGHGAGVSVIASHHSNPCPVDDRSACQGSPTGARPLRPPYDWMKRQTYQTVPSAGKTRTKDKYRVVYSDHQRLELEKEFHYSRYITIRRKAELAQNLSLSERQVKIWFQNRRAKERKQKKKEDTLRGVQVITEVPVQGEALANAQSLQMHSQSQPTLPSPEMNQSQTPHLTHTRAQTQEMMRQEEVPSSSSLEVLQP